MSNHIYIESITMLMNYLPHQAVEHPLVALVNFDDYTNVFAPNTKVSLGFYGIILCEGCQHRLWYGQRAYDFTAGSMLCIAPNQVLTIGAEEEQTDKEDSWGLFFHPDFIRRTPLGQRMQDYGFFSYRVNEALHLSASERATLRGVLGQIRVELQQGIDKHTQMLISSNIELMLNYCIRYYERQFITRSAVEGGLVERIEEILTGYLRQESLEGLGLPSVAYLAEQVGLSSSYMSDQLKQEIGHNAQEYIHLRVIEEAKTRLLSTEMNVSELAYSLGFEYPQYFSRLFKAKVGCSPLEYRRGNA